MASYNGKQSFYKHLPDLANSITSHVSWRPEGKVQTFLWQQDGMPNKTLFVGCLLKIHLYILTTSNQAYTDSTASNGKVSNNMRQSDDK